LKRGDQVGVTVGKGVPGTGPGSFLGPRAALIWKIAAIRISRKRQMIVISVNRRTGRG
jgi:hypothetical protein